ncbi:MAG: hypothetical protein EOP56_01130 [Sphingobacteriales bacterium]|nr:MAG: hypothetical protein EOP56_01130 [Sphingobacteriales bacterium]
MKLIYSLLAATLLSGAAIAQEKTEKEKKSMAIVISPDEVGIEKTDEKKEEKTFEMEYVMFDLGINSIHDKTDYTSTEAKNFLKVENTAKNQYLFSQRTAKAVNVNIWPVMAKWRVAKGKNQKVYLSSGLGLQIYNFRFNKNISYVSEPNPGVIMDSINFSKNKLGITYLSVPLMATFKTRVSSKTWLVYGVGVTGGYRIDSWTKQKSTERGKDKNHDKFNFADFNTCLTAEIGLSGYFRLYGSYQVTALHENALDQHPFAIGIRLGGM